MLSCVQTLTVDTGTSAIRDGDFKLGPFLLSKFKKIKDWVKNSRSGDEFHLVCVCM